MPTIVECSKCGKWFEEDIKKGGKSKVVVRCTCHVCGCVWSYDDLNEDKARAVAAPCGHQGVFRVETIGERK